MLPIPQTPNFGEAFADRWDFLTKPYSRNEIIQKARNLTALWERKRREKEYLQQIQAQQEQLMQQERLAAVGTLARGIGHEDPVEELVIRRIELRRDVVDGIELSGKLRTKHSRFHGVCLAASTTGPPVLLAGAHG